MADRIPRGIRNNNPLNIRRGDRWKGLAAVQADPEFCQFTSMVWGIRAAFCCIRTYILKHRLNTVELIVSRWAPPSENDTQTYIREVVKLSGIPRNYVLSFYDRQVMFALVSSMALMESGRLLSLEDMAAAYSLV